MPLDVWCQNTAPATEALLPILKINCFVKFLTWHYRQQGSNTAWHQNDAHHRNTATNTICWLFVFPFQMQHQRWQGNQCHCICSIKMPPPPQKYCHHYQRLFFLMWHQRWQDYWCCSASKCCHQCCMFFFSSPPFLDIVLKVSRLLMPLDTWHQSLPRQQKFSYAASKVARSSMLPQ